MKQGKKYYVISGADSSSRFVFEMKNNPQKHCRKSAPVCPKTSYSFYMERVSEGFDMDTGRNLGGDKYGATEILQNLAPKRKTDFGQFHAHKFQLVRTQKS